MHCKQCDLDKSADDFYKSNQTRCKECVKASVNAHRQENLEKIRAYDRMRGSMPHRVAARTEYQKTEAFTRSHGAAVKRWVAHHPDRRRANVILNNALRRGRVERWPVCAIPDCTCGQVEGHHPDYGAPLDVVWLCPQHHSQLHEEHDARIRPLFFA